MKPERVFVPSVGPGVGVVRAGAQVRHVVTWTVRVENSGQTEPDATVPVIPVRDGGPSPTWRWERLFGLHPFAKPQ